MFRIPSQGTGTAILLACCFPKVEEHWGRPAPAMPRPRGGQRIPRGGVAVWVDHTYASHMSAFPKLIYVPISPGGYQKQGMGSQQRGGNDYIRKWIGSVDNPDSPLPLSPGSSSLFHAYDAHDASSLSLFHDLNNVPLPPRSSATRNSPRPAHSPHPLRSSR